MKKKVICVFSLILWALAACTLLSLRIEELMITKAAVCEPGSQGMFSQQSEPGLSLDCLFFDETGMHLYAATEGSGWESGTRVTEIPQSYYSVGVDSIDISYYGKVIRYASKPPQNGGVAEIQKMPKKLDDTWLAVFPDGVPDLGELPDSLSIQKKLDTALLLSAVSAEQPFMADRAKSMLSVPEQGGETAASYYSLLDMEAFVRELPKVSLLFVLLILPLFLWTYSCFLAKDPRKNRFLLLANAGLGAFLLIGVALLLHWIDLPSSLLPQSNIFSFSHYGKEFAELFAALEAFSTAGEQTAAAALQNANSALMSSLAVLLGGVLLGAALVVLEVSLRKKRSPKGRHAR